MNTQLTVMSLYAMHLNAVQVKLLKLHVFLLKVQNASVPRCNTSCYCYLYPQPVSVNKPASLACLTDDSSKPASVVKHSLPAFLILFDMFVSAFPMRLAHSIYPAVYGVIYVVFSFVFWREAWPAIDGPGKLYSVLDWNRPAPTLATAFGVILLQCFIHVSFVRLLPARLT